MDAAVEEFDGFSADWAMAMAAKDMPGDWIAAMMARQMAELHNAVMDCLEEAETYAEPEIKTRFLREGGRLMALFVRQGQHMARRRRDAELNAVAEAVRRAEAPEEAAARGNRFAAMSDDELLEEWGRRRDLADAGRHDDDDVEDDEDEAEEDEAEEEERGAAEGRSQASQSAPPSPHPEPVEGSASVWGSDDRGYSQTHPSTGSG